MFKLKHNGKIHNTRTGERLDGADGYYLDNYAAAAGVEVNWFPTRTAAESAAKLIQETVDVDGVTIGVEVEVTDSRISGPYRSFWSQIDEQFLLHVCKADPSTEIDDRQWPQQSPEDRDRIAVAAAWALWHLHFTSMELPEYDTTGAPNGFRAWTEVVKVLDWGEAHHGLPWRQSTFSVAELQRKVVAHVDAFLANKTGRNEKGLYDIAQVVAKLMFLYASSNLQP